MSGIFLYLFLLFITWFFSLSVVYPESQILLETNTFFLSSLGKLFIGGGAFLFYYHLFCGIRHLFMDTGCGFGIKTMQFTGILVLFCSLMLAGMTLFVLYFN
jgi:succinate dehydrogenase / fumarate reductase cytochrome b subunit